MVGQHFVRLLHDHPAFELVMVTASERSRGIRYLDATDWMIGSTMPESVHDLILQETTATALQIEEVDVVFSALPSQIAGPVEDDAASIGVPVFSNAGAHRMRPDVPILIPEINSQHLQLVSEQRYAPGFIVTNSNCSTSGLVFGLKPLMAFGLEEVNVTTMQAVSGAGRRGVASLDILGNIIPHIKNEEQKMETEPQKILGSLVDGRVRSADFRITATCTRVPVANGHLESVSVKLKEDISAEDAISAFSEFAGDIPSLGLSTAPIRPITVFLEHDHPQPSRDLFTTDDPLGMSIKIGRVRKKGDSIQFILLVHNTMRGAAGASVLNAEYAFHTGYLDEVIA